MAVVVVVRSEMESKGPLMVVVESNSSSSRNGKRRMPFIRVIILSTTLLPNNYVDGS